MTPDSDSRLMLVAPHPDDEALACSIILQRAVRAGAAIRVIYATDGDDNPWPQRVLERKWRISASDRRRWGKLRRGEALAALALLEVDTRMTKFFALPDQGLTNLLRTDGGVTIKRFSDAIREWLPTDLLVPSISDTHPDHSALGVMLRLAVADLCQPQMSVWSYAVHGKSPAFFNRAQSLGQTKSETARKLAAIHCHKSQITLSRKRFVGYAARPERLLKLAQREEAVADGAIRSAVRQSEFLHLEVRLSPKLITTGQTGLFILGRDLAGRVRALKAPFPADTRHIGILDCSSERLYGEGKYCGKPSGGEFTFPVDVYSPEYPLFVKLERRSLFFDEAGWLEIPALIRSPQVIAEQRQVEEAALAIH